MGAQGRVAMGVQGWWGPRGGGGPGVVGAQGWWGPRGGGGPGVGCLFDMKLTLSA